MPRLVSLICLVLIAVLRLVGGATSTPIIQIHDDLFDSRADVAQEAVNTGCGAAFIPDLGVREQNAALALHLEREVLSPSHCSLLAIHAMSERRDSPSETRHSAGPSNQEGDRNRLRRCDSLALAAANRTCNVA